MFFFFFNDPATTEIYTLSLHDALPISLPIKGRFSRDGHFTNRILVGGLLYTIDLTLNVTAVGARDRKSTRLNSSHSQISYAVFCLKKKKKKNTINNTNTAQTIYIFSNT